MDTNVGTQGDIVINGGILGRIEPVTHW